MKILKKLARKIMPFAAATSLVALVGCDEIKYSQSPVLHEDAYVADTVYTPSRHDLGLGLTVLPVGDSFGVDFSGNMGLRLGNNVQISSSRVPEKWAVVFKCKHGGFISQGSDERHKNLYQKFASNSLPQSVNITYREIYRDLFRDINKDGTNELASRTLTKYDFLDAQPKTNSVVESN